MIFWSVFCTVTLIFSKSFLRFEYWISFAFSKSSILFDNVSLFYTGDGGYLLEAHEDCENEAGGGENVEKPSCAEEEVRQD